MQRESPVAVALAAVVAVGALFASAAFSQTTAPSSRQWVSGRATLSRLALMLESEEGGGGGLPPVLHLPRDAQMVLFGDFLSPLEEIHRVLRGYAEGGVRGHVVQVLDPAEETLPYDGRVRFEGLEGETPWMLSRVEAVRGDYLRRIEAQRNGVEAIARSLSWSYSHHRSDLPPQAALLHLYTALSQRARR